MTKLKRKFKKVRINMELGEDVSTALSDLAELMQVNRTIATERSIRVLAKIIKETQKDVGGIDVVIRRRDGSESIILLI